MKYIALIAGKLSYFFLRLLGKNATAFPGKLTLNIDDKLIEKFKFPETFILVTGTNGKSTITAMISKIFEKSGIKIDTNSTGSNIINGILTTLISASSLSFKLKRPLILEIDELTVAKYLPTLKPSVLVISNLFDDQMDRAGSADEVYDRLLESIKDYEGKLIINGDDPRLTAIGKQALKAKVIPYGILKSEGIFTNKNNAPLENEEIFKIMSSPDVICPKCSHLLDYQEIFYSQIGKFHCKNCDFENLPINYEAKNLDFKEKSMAINAESYQFKIPAKYHIYNCLASISTAKEHKIRADEINSVISDFSLGNARMEEIKFNNTDIMLNLAKNPAGMNETIDYITNSGDFEKILILINAAFADGRDTGWLWDCNFEKLRGINEIIATGDMSEELALRLKYADFADNTIIVSKDLTYCTKLLTTDVKKSFAIVNYSGIDRFRKEMKLV